MAELCIELWAVTKTDLSGVSHVAVSSSRDQAVSHFMQTVYLFIHAAPDEKFTIVGDDWDAALTGLHLIWESEKATICVASLTRPGSIGSNPGYAPPAMSKRSFVDIADELKAAIAFGSNSLSPNDIERLKHSSAAMVLGRFLAEELLVPDESVDHKKVSLATAKRMWSSMGSVDQYIQMTAVVRSGDNGN